VHYPRPCLFSVDAVEMKVKCFGAKCLYIYMKHIRNKVQDFENYCLTRAAHEHQDILELGTCIGTCVFHLKDHDTQTPHRSEFFVLISSILSLLQVLFIYFSLINYDAVFNILQGLQYTSCTCNYGWAHMG